MLNPDQVKSYIEQGLALAGSDPVLAAEYLEEARRAESRAAAPHRHDEILGALAAAWNVTSRSKTVIEVLAHEPQRSGEVLWQLARAYALLGDRAHAAQTLDDLGRMGPAHAQEAAALRATLTP